MTSDVKPWELERYLLGELPPDRREAVRRAVDADPAIREQLEALARSNREIFSRYAPPDEALEIRAAIDRRREKAGFRKTGRPHFGFGRALAGRRPAIVPAAAGLLVVCLGGYLALSLLRSVSAPDSRDKGGASPGEGPRIQIHRKTALADIVLEDGAVAEAGDLLQISYTAAGARYGVIISLDGRGTVTFHFPEGGSGSTELRPGRGIPLPGAYELDASPGFERFFFVTSSRPFDVRAVRRSVSALSRDLAAARSAPLDLPPGLSQFSFLLRKGSRP